MRLKSFLAAALLGASALTLSGCATGFPAKVSRYQAMPAPQGQSFFVVPANPAAAGGLQFTQFAGVVASALQAQGYAPAANPASASMLVTFDYGVDKGQTQYVRDPFALDNPFYRGAYWGRPYYSRWGYYGARSPFYYGWDDPFFSPVGAYGYSRQTVYKSFVDVNIRRKADNASLFEGQAQAKSANDNLGTLVPNLVTALFTNFPGNSGETVRIVVPPERKAR